MSTFRSVVAVGALLLAGGAQGHMTLHEPAPYGKPDNSPLSSGGSNYPCKVGSGLQANAVTRVTAGTPMQVSFDGSAVHAGGSCQISLSKDGASSLNPNSQFKVIYSIMGGCPGTDGAGKKFKVNVPKEVPTGEYTLAWTWFNKIGNREMYMNCAPISVAGGQGSEGSFQSLPDMAVYNIASKNDCKTTETKDVQFPNPGQYVETGPGAALAPPTGSCASGAASGGSPSTFPGLGASGGGGSGAGVGSGTSGGNNGLYTPPAAPAPAAPQVAKQPPPPAALPPPPPAVSASGFISHPNGSTCSTEGAVVCGPDGSKFGLCNFGRVRFMAVSAGTQCKNGAIVRRNIWSKKD